MNVIFNWYDHLSLRLKNSVALFTVLFSVCSGIATIAGASMADIPYLSGWHRLGIVLALFLVGPSIFYFFLGYRYRSSINLFIRKTPITIECGDIFKSAGLKVIGCDTNFHTEVDDVVIAKRSLHGQLMLNHSDINTIQSLVEKEAGRLNLTKNSKGFYDFPLGTIIRYDNIKEKQTYLMLALMKLDSQYEAHTNMADFESMLMKMWREISRVYAQEDVALPVLGTGISRFDDGPQWINLLAIARESLSAERLRCWRVLAPAFYDFGFLSVETPAAMLLKA